MRFAKEIAKVALALGVMPIVVMATLIMATVILAIGTAPATAQINIDVPGLHVHVGRHHRHYYPPPGPGPGYYSPGGYYGYDYAPCPRGFTVQDGVCKPYRGY